MLGGLEASEIKLSEVLKGAATFRLDSEYFQKQYLHIEKLIAGRVESFEKLHALGLQVDASAFYPALEPYYGAGELPFLRVADVKEVVDYENCTRIPETILSDFPTLQTVSAGDIVLTKGGSIARAGLITRRAAVSRDLIFINSSKLSEVEYTYLWLYSQTGFFNKLLIRSSSMTAQPHLTLTLVKELDIYKTTRSFKGELLLVTNAAHHKLEQSKALYAAAESLLLDELGLTGWQPSEESVAVKSFAASFGSSGRLDAEFYQPKYSNIIEHCKAAKLGWHLLDEITTSITNGVESREFVQEGVPYIRVGDMRDLEIDSHNARRIPQLEAEELLPKISLEVGDVLTARSGSIGQAAVAKEKDKGSVLSSHLMRLRLKPESPIRSTYLALFLATLPGVQQVMMHSNGAIVPEISQPGMRRIVIPVASSETQSQILNRLADSASTRLESKRLLDRAKRGVEMAIEADERAALEWMMDEAAKSQVETEGE